MTNYKGNLVLVAAISALLAVFATVAVIAWLNSSPAASPSVQSMVHESGGGVMPFDLGKTTHIFEMTESGGIQQVIADDPSDSAQVALIQQHIQHEALLFAAGDFSDPSSLHGADMPGVSQLSSAAADIDIEYMPLSNGAQISFTTQDLGLVTAIHRWFGAQLSDHGEDATYR